MTTMHSAKSKATPVSTATATQAPAVAAIRSIGAKVTTPRVMVLRVLQAAAAPMSHRELLDSLRSEADSTIDRVTVYRVLDWLVAMSLASKAADALGVFRFAALQSAGTHDTHVHFRCTGCGGVFCLKDAPPPPPRVPKGFRLASVSVDIRGECPRCAAVH